VTLRLRLGSAFLVGVTFVFAARVGADDLPRVTVDAPVHDFGSVEQGTAVEHVFRLKNTGRGTLRVDHVKGTCACTVGVATGEAIGPGEEACVTMRLDTAKLAGRTTKVATVYTNDPVAPTVPVALTGQVLADLVVRPTAIYVGRMRRDSVARRELAVQPGRPGGTASIASVESASPRVRAWLEAANDGGGQRVVVEVDAKAASGRFTDDLVLRTTSAVQPILTVKVLGSIDPG
jgi:hypothetical protein